MSDQKKSHRKVRLNWISQPTNYEHQIAHHNISRLLQDLEIESYGQAEYAGGRIAYNLRLIIAAKQEELLQQLRENIWQVTEDMINFTLILDNDSRVEEKINQAIAKIKCIASFYLAQIISHVDVHKIVLNKHNILYNFIPRNEQGQFITCASNLQKFVQQRCNLQLLKDYQVFIKCVNPQTLDVGLIDYLRLVDDSIASHSIIQVDNTILIANNFSDDALLNNNMLYNKFSDENYFSIQTHDLARDFDYDLIEELAEMWDFTKIAHLPDTQTFIYRLQDEHKVEDVREWFLQNLNIISKGYLPLYTISGAWQYLDDLSWSIIQYAAIKSYVHIQHVYDYSMLSFNIDNSITAPFASHQDVQEFERRFLPLLQHQDWSLVKCENIIQAVVRRWQVQQADKFALIAINSQDIYLVSEYNLDDINWDDNASEKELLQALRNFFSRCHNNNINIAQLNLYQLLTLVYTTFEQQMYCANADQIDNLMHNLNFNKQRNIISLNFDSDATSVATSDEVNTNATSDDVDTNATSAATSLEDDRNATSAATSLEVDRYRNSFYGLLGFFDVGPLRGLRPEPPVRPIIQPSVQELQRYVTDTSQPLYQHKAHLQQLYTYELVEAERVHAIMQLSAPNQGYTVIKGQNISNEQVDDKIQHLWRSGWFLSDWAIAYRRVTGKNSVVLMADRPFIAAAGETRADGHRAIEVIVDI